MEKPKEIKVIFLLAFLIFTCPGIAQNLVPKDPTIQLKVISYSFKFGINYLNEKINNDDLNEPYKLSSGGYHTASASISENHSLNRSGIYFNFGKLRERSKTWSTYSGISFFNYRMVFTYMNRSEKPVTPFPTNQYKREYFVAEGYINRYIIGYELNFEAKIKNTRIILSPFNPSVIFSNANYTKREILYFDAHVSYTSPYSNDSLVTFTGKEDSNFSIQRPYLPGVIVLPFYIGIEQRIPLKKHAVLIGAKGSFVINSIRSKSYSYGGQLYTGFEF